MPKKILKHFTESIASIADNYTAYKSPFNCHYVHQMGAQWPTMGLNKHTLVMHPHGQKIKMPTSV